MRSRPSAVDSLGEAVEAVDVQGRATVPPPDLYGIYQQIAPQFLPRDDHSPTNGVRTYGVRRSRERRRDPWPPAPWIRALSEGTDERAIRGLEVLASYAPTSEVTPENLDTAFAKWKSDCTSQRAPAKDVAWGLGALFGNLVVKRKQAEWAVVTDSYGTEIAVRSAAGAELFPGTVWKRVDPKNLDISSSSRSGH